MFGFELQRRNPAEEEKDKRPSFAPPPNDDGSMVVAEGSFYGTFMDLNGSISSEADLITKYREMALYPDVEYAVDDIVNEAITLEDDGDVVRFNMDAFENSSIFSRPDIQKRVEEEFKRILELLDFNNNAYEIFKRWYVDGRLYYHVIIDEKNTVEGIKELRYIDPRKIRKVKEVKRIRPVMGGSAAAIQLTQLKSEYFVYSSNGFGKAPVGSYSSPVDATVYGLKIASDSVIYSHSGLLDPNGNMVLSYLHKAIRVLNALKALEDSLVIYRFTRAPERRLFNVDVGTMPANKAEQYVTQMMIKHKNKLVYDQNNGTIKDDRRFMCYALDTKIPLLDGRTLTLQQIMDEYEAGEKNWVYSCDPVTGKFVPGPVSWAGITKRNSEVVRVTFDNGESVVCTPDHKFPVWNKGFVEAKDLVGESIIPGYRRMKEIAKDGQLYEQIYRNEDKKWVFTHREVEKWKVSHGITEAFTYSQEYTESDYAEQLHNHKAVSVEYLTETIDVGCLTVDLEETYHSHHTYLLDAGVYTKNTMFEDYWLPKREGGKGTTIDVLPGGQNLGELSDVNYFQNKLYRALSVPTSRMNPETSGFTFSKAAEISRDEVKFSKFIDRLRRRFSLLLFEALSKQLVLKNVIAKEEISELYRGGFFEFASDNHFAEVKDNEIMSRRIEVAKDIQDFVGKYFSHEYVRKKVLRQTDDDIETLDAEIETEKDDPRYKENPFTGGNGIGVEDPTFGSQAGAGGGMPPEMMGAGPPGQPGQPGDMPPQGPQPINSSKDST